MKGKMDVAVLGIGKMGATHVKSAKASPYVNQIYGYEPDAGSFQTAPNSS